jgi:P27 family predicted phage terminase small subunit
LSTDLKIVKKEGEMPADTTDDLAEIQVTPPKHLDQAASRLWTNLIPEIRKMGYLKKVDQANLELYCKYYSMYLASEELIRKQGLWLYNKDHEAVKRSPGATQLDACVKGLRELGHELGLSFDAGMRTLSVGEPKQEKKTPLQGVKFGAEV